MKLHTKLIAASVFVLLFTLRLLPVGAQEPLSITADNLNAAQFPNLNTQVIVLENGLAKHGLTQANFTVFEDSNTENVLESVQEVSSHKGLAVSLIFDFDVTGDTSLYRPMQEYAQSILDGIDLGLPSDDISHVVEVRTSGGKVLTPYTQDATAVKNGIRQMLIEDMQTRELNGTLIEVLGADTEGRKQVVLVIGSGGDITTLSPVVDKAIQRDAAIHTLAFSDKADPTYLEGLAANTRGQYFGNPQDIAPNAVKNALFGNFQSHYLLKYASRLYQTDQDSHTATVTVSADGVQAETVAEFFYPSTGTIIPKFNSLPLLWAYTGLLAVTVLFLLVRLFRAS